MTEHIFVDTSALIALGNKRDAFHFQAIGINDKLSRSNITFVFCLNLEMLSVRLL